MIFFLPILAITFWLAGYFMTARKMSNVGLNSEDLEKIIAPPQWVYYLCGAPNNKDYPRGTMRVIALRTQIIGITSMILFLYSIIWKLSGMEYLIGLVFVFLVSYTLTSYISKKYFTGEQFREQIKYKKGNFMTPTKITDDLSYSIDGESVNLYSEFGANGGANLTVEYDEIDAVIEALQIIKANMQYVQPRETGE